MKAFGRWMLAGIFVLLVIFVFWRVVASKGSATFGQSAQTAAWASAAGASRKRSPTADVEPKVAHEPTVVASQSRSSSVSAPVAAERSLPPNDTPWANLYAQLIGRAKQGDQRAASRLYRDAMKCDRYLIALTEAQMEASRPKSAASIPAGRLEGTVKYLDSIKRGLAASENVCSGVSRDRFATEAYEVVWNAARLGDPNAAACNAGGFIAPPESVIRDSVAQDRYRQRALGLMHRGLKRGNWRMVYLMRGAYGPKSSLGGDWGTNLFKPNLEKEYALTRLLWLGAVDANASHDIAWATAASDELRHLLPPKLIEAANAWAQQTFDNNFASRPYLETTDGDMTYCNPVNPTLKTDGR